MPFFHGIVTRVTGLWIRVITGAGILNSDNVVEELEGGPYRPAFLEHFFADSFRVEVRKIHAKFFGNFGSESPTKTSLSGEVIKFSTASDQYTVRIKGNAQGWLSAFNGIGLIIGNSRKMSKRLIEIVRLASTWTYRSADLPLAIEVINYPGRETDVDGISAISQSFFFECVDSNKSASREWRRSMKASVRRGKTSVVSLRVLTPMGLIKGNALVLPDWMMENQDIRTFAPNIKSELRTSGWYWATIDPSYGAIPVKSDDLSHAIYRGVKGLYDDETLMGTLRAMLNEFYKDLKSGKRSEWMESLADNADDILHDKEAFDKYAKNRGLVGRIQLAVAQLAAVGVPLTASQTLMFMSVNGLRKQLLGEYKPGTTWQDKSKHWFPVPWAYSAHIMTAEALRTFGFYIPETDKGFYHEDTHCFVVPGDFFARNYENHGGYDLDDTVKVHIRQVVMPDGSSKTMAILLRNPNDFGEWSMIEVDDHGPVYHAYKEMPVVNLNELEGKVPQWTKLKSQLNIGSLPCVTNPEKIGDVFSLEDEERTRRASLKMPGGVGTTVIVKMIWYAMKGKPIEDLCASNEDIIDALQQGLAGSQDIELIQKWVDLYWGRIAESKVDYFWYHTRVPKAVFEKYGIRVGSKEDSSWLALHKEREERVRDAIEVMKGWLNTNVLMPEVLSSIEWSSQELTQMDEHLAKIQRKKRLSTSWTEDFVEILRKSDKDKGEEHTDRRMLLLAYASLVAKQQNPRSNHDQWLYNLSSAEVQPVDWFIRALKRVNPMTDGQISEIRSLYKQVDKSLSDTQKESLVSKMRRHSDGSEPQNLEWGQKVIDRLSALREG